MRLGQLSLGIVVSLLIASPAVPKAPAEAVQPGAVASGRVRGASSWAYRAQIAGSEKSKGQGYQFNSAAGSHLDGKLADTPHMRVGRDAAPWLPRILKVIKKNRPPRFKLFKSALITGGRDIQYLALQWNEGLPEAFRGHYKWPLELHRVIHLADGIPRVKWLRSYRGMYADLITPTGQAVFKGEAPIAVIFVNESGGQSAGSTMLRLIQLKRNTVDITPDWAGRVVDVVDLDGDNHYELVAVARGYLNEIDRTPHGHSLPVILSRRDGRFMHACRAFSGAFATSIEIDLESARPRHVHPLSKAASLSSALTTYVQIGAFDEARGLLGDLGEAVAAIPPEDFTMEFTVEQVLEDHLALVRWAEGHPEEACPASAPPVGPADHMVFSGTSRSISKLPKLEDGGACPGGGSSVRTPPEGFKVDQVVEDHAALLAWARNHPEEASQCRHRTRLAGHMGFPGTSISQSRGRRRTRMTYSGNKADRLAA